MPPGGMDLKILLNGSVDLFSHFTKCKNNKKSKFRFRIMFSLTMIDSQTKIGVFLCCFHNR